MNFDPKINPQQAAKIMGIGILFMVFFSILGLLPLLNLIEYGDETATKANIEDNKSAFIIGIICYYIILILDVIVAVALYAVLKPTKESLAFNTMLLRVIYASINSIAVSALALQYTTMFDYTTLLAYFFFICHLFVLGYTILKADYIPNWIGALLIIASFSYLITEYGDFVFSGNLYDIFYTIALIPASIAELTLAIYLLVRNSKMPIVTQVNKVIN